MRVRFDDAMFDGFTRQWAGGDLDDDSYEYKAPCMMHDRAAYYDHLYVFSSRRLDR